MKNLKNISKWLNDEMTDEELVAFHKTDDYQLYKNIVEEAENINLTSVNETVALQDFKARIANRTKKKTKVISFNRNLAFKVAASITLLIGITYFLFNFNQETLKAGFAENKSFVLPDESTVTLNAVSQITYSKTSFKTKRQLKLNGEAYFSVKKGSTFNVKTEQGTIEVLGTKFNVKSRENSFRVFCYEGSVAVSHNNSKVILAKGESAQLTTNNTLIKLQKTESSGPLWLNNESSFIEESYTEVLAEFERQFKVKIISKAINTNVLFTGGFSNNNIDSAIKSITLPLNINYRINDNEIILSK
ncbi:MAG: FecR family protein [Lutibacter sp.]|uniref:FecR family protein n=1 Tax=Lutibacter sp. TaxID=1925666 RepID=UPI00179E0E72|nr:FecR family protein [Lutibacter sp.]MBT8317716.1 FecR family protein [Lutibacter sp.]NNJ58574.1 FecR family protein [Lutibacter sp.]